VSNLDEDALKELTKRAFQRVGMLPDMAEDAAEMLVLAELMGIGTHGLSRVESYVARLRDGGVNPKARPVIAAPAPALRHVDGQNGLGAAVAIRATRAAMDAARDVGMGAAFCHASSHLGALAPQLLHAAEAGFAAIFVTNTSPMIAPQGGRSAVIGNTPLGIALPDPEGQHVILDFAMSVAARSKVRAIVIEPRGSFR
jgi:LDH2 family malate/lactate/ureidoglycolate dehydrogenase